MNRTQSSDSNQNLYRSTKVATSNSKIFPQSKAMIVLLLSMVEAAGVEPVISTENTQVTDTENA